MAEEKNADLETSAEYKAPEGSRISLECATSSLKMLNVDVSAEWIVLRKKEKPVAEIFHVAYLADGFACEDRPITFVFNGGPGAASAYLHVGAIGPKRVKMGATGNAPAPPVELVRNTETWLEFTDLVFIDPVGTGFSRIVDRKQLDGTGDGSNGKGEATDENEFFDLKRDLESLGEFIQRFLSIHGRWKSPVFIAGESYGGFRVARLTKLLQQGYGIGLSGAILLSPALELDILASSDYDILPWIDAFPSMALSAYRHGKAKTLESESDFDVVRATVEQFAVREFPSALIDGSVESEQRRNKIVRRAARFLGLNETDVVALGGRIRPGFFARNLLRTERLVCGMYDATITSVDPYPDRDSYEGPDPTLWGIERVFTAGINAHLREELGVSTDREYHLLSMEVNKAWKTSERDGIAGQVGSMDDLRYGMSINPHMKVLISHGYYDLVTPYFASNRLAALMKLDVDSQSRLALVHFPGGHMFYTWEESRRSFYTTVQRLYGSALSDKPQQRGLYRTLTERSRDQGLANG
jgi:carboxypeptidase C (cathepsin A)